MLCILLLILSTATAVCAPAGGNFWQAVEAELIIMETCNALRDERFVCFLTFKSLQLPTALLLTRVGLSGGFDWPGVVRAT